jgi:hypothetical protein
VGLGLLGLINRPHDGLIFLYLWDLDLEGLEPALEVPEIGLADLDALLLVLLEKVRRISLREFRSEAL